MNKYEAAFFYGDYSELSQEWKELELSENVDTTNTSPEFSNSNDYHNVS